MAAKKSHTTMADKADKYTCYEQAVQCVEAEIDFIDSTFKQIRGRHAQTLREDFCGTANTACEWIKRRRTNTAVAVDLDQNVLAWCRRNKLTTLKPQVAKRVTLLHDNVLTVKTNPVEIVLAMNFSYWIFNKRGVTIDYFRKVNQALVSDGIFFLDAYGGYEAFQELTEETQHDDFTYIWDQDSYNPITGIAKNYIHFKFKDNSQIKRAFSYEWRIWTIPELVEMLTEAGFKPTVYWEQADDEGEGNGIFLPTNAGEADPAWVAYIVAEK